MNDRPQDRPAAPAPELPSVSPGATARFERSLPAILQIVSERFRIEAELSAEAPRGDALEFVQDSHQHFGRTLLAVCAFGLFAELPGEAAWYLRTLECRDFGPDIFRRVIRSWTLAVLAEMPLAQGREIVRPLEWIASRIDELKGLADRPPPGPGPEAEVFLDLVRRGEKERAAAYAVSRLESGASLDRVVDDLILGSLARLGALWADNEIGVADEHIATAGIREAALRFFDRVPRAEDRKASVAVACVPGDEHDLGPEILARYLEAKGWRTVFLGRSAPESELAGALARMAPAAAILSLPLLSHLVSGLRALERIRREAPSVRVIAGGRAALAAARAVLRVADAVAGSFAEAERLLARRPGG